MRRREYLGQLELMVLLAIRNLAPNAYGVSIAQEIKTHGGHDLSLAGIYSTLERLARKGLVKGVRGEPTSIRGGKARTYFSITAAGAREAQATYGTLLRLATQGASP